jgi:hypothetical protein
MPEGKIEVGGSPGGGHRERVTGRGSPGEGHREQRSPGAGSLWVHLRGESYIGGHREHIFLGALTGLKSLQGARKS